MLVLPLEVRVLETEPVLIKWLFAGTALTSDSEHKELGKRARREYKALASV